MPRKRRRGNKVTNDSAISSSMAVNQLHFLNNFVIRKGSISKACRDVGITRTTFYRWKNEDDKFVAKLEEKLKEIADSFEEQENEIAIFEGNSVNKHVKLTHFSG